MIYKAFNKQIEFHLARDRYRIRGAFAGKRGGKTECGAVEGCIYSDQKRKYIDNGIDPYIGVIIAPTGDMLRRLSLKKFLAYGKDFVVRHNKSDQEIVWQNGSVIYGISGERPQRIEGIKANWIWIDEVFQVSEQLFLEAQARVADTEGDIWCTGSLGVQYINPKQHWAYRYFKEAIDEDTGTFEWATADNPYFSRRELSRLAQKLDPMTFRQMFTLTWDTQPKNAVYDDFTEDNLIKDYVYNPALETWVSIDWGWTHPMAVGFFQYDPRNQTVILFDEIVQSKLTLSQLWDKIKAKNYRITQWVCDIAGNQEREQTGYSNVKWFQDEHQIDFKYASSAITYGIPIVRSFIKNGLGQRRFKVSERMCPKSIDGLKNYSYAEKDGQILNENPIKENDDAVDMIRYYFVNRFDPRNTGDTMRTFKRFGGEL